MALPITPVSMPRGIPSLQPSIGSTGPPGSFQSVLSDAVTRVQQAQDTSQTSIDKFLSGEDEEIHKVALATQQAELSFDLFLQVRNKVISAYQEVMRMQM
jgi:flagellar hook-basal body complex protein FliE